MVVHPCVSIVPLLLPVGLLPPPLEPGVSAGDDKGKDVDGEPLLETSGVGDPEDIRAGDISS